VLERAAATIASRYPGAVVAGTHHGYFAPGEEERVVRRIAAARPDVLFVAMPTPAKERVLALHGRALAVPFALGVGGSVDVLAGVRRRAPRWAQRAGLEWLARFVQEPRRLAPTTRANAAFARLVTVAAFRALRGRVPAGAAGAAGGGRTPAPRDRGGAADAPAPRPHSRRPSPAPPDRDGPETGRG
jgi:N-acetylglucosaminyldiphosphoundecaprenol N-acetyl-beta-D-mannosaminyltransferase